MKQGHKNDFSPKKKYRLWWQVNRMIKFNNAVEHQNHLKEDNVKSEIMFWKGASKFASENLPAFLRSSKICRASDFVELLIVNINTGLLTKEDHLLFMKWPGSSCSSTLKRDWTLLQMKWSSSLQAKLMTRYRTWLLFF